MADQEQIFAAIQSQITQVLIAASDPRDPNYHAATQQFLDWELNYFPMWMTALAFELADDSKGSSTSREVAGYQLRRLLVSTEEGRQRELLERWNQVPYAAKAEIKNKLLPMMQSTVTSYRHSAAAAVAQIAVLEIPTDSWKGIVKLLSDGVTANDSSDVLKEAALLALGDICRGCDPPKLAPHSFEILYALITGMSSSHKEIQLQAINALTGALKFSEANFREDELRASIMEYVMKLALHEDAQVRLSTWECIVQIASTYYDYLPPNMNDLLQLSLNAMKSDPNEKIVQQAIEFWSTICEEEITIADENRILQEAGEVLTPCHNFIKGAVSFLEEPLCECLSRGDEDPDLANWTTASAASACITLMSLTLGDDIVNYFIRFTSANIQNADDQIREAAVLAFGSIMEGPTTEAVTPVLAVALPILCQTASDSNIMVKCTTVWALEIIARYHPDAISDLKTFIDTLCVSLQDTTRVAATASNALEHLANHITVERRPDSPLNPFLQQLFENVISAADRNDSSNDPTLRLAAYAAFRALINATPDVAVHMIQYATTMFTDRLKASIGGSIEVELQGEMVGIITACIKRLDAGIGEYSNQVMGTLLDLLRSRSGVSEIFQDVFMAVGALAIALGPNFQPYVESFGEFLVMALEQSGDPELVIQGVHMVSALCFALMDQFAPYCDGIMKIFQHHLNQPDMDRSLGPVIVNSFSDIALVLGNEFMSYLSPVMDILSRFQDIATKKTDAMDDADDIDFVKSWRCSILVVYSLILQSVGENNSQSVQVHFRSMSRLLSYIADDKRKDDRVNRYACGLIYDLCECFPNSSESLKSYEPFLHLCLNSAISEPATVDAAKMALERLSQ